MSARENLILCEDSRISSDGDHSNKLISQFSLPQELLEIIVDHFHDDTSSLKACSVVCTSFLIASRPHLLWSIHIPVFDDEIFYHFSQLLLNSPTLPTHIQKFKFGVPDGTRTPKSLPLAIETALISILDLMPRLQSLSLAQLSFKKASHRFRQCIYRLLELSTITSVELQYVTSIPSAFFRLLPSTLNVLKVTNFGPGSRIQYWMLDGPHPEHYPDIRLTTLTLSNASLADIFPGVGSNLSCLTTFSYHYCGIFEGLCLQRILSMCSRTLQHLTISHTLTQSDYGLPIFNLKILNNLKLLTFKACVRGFTTRSPKPCAWASTLTSALMSLDNGGPIEVIAFEFYLKVPRDLPLTSSYHFPGFARCRLQSPISFPFLREIRVALHCQRLEHASIEEATIAVTNQMKVEAPHLFEHRTTKVSVKVSRNSLSKDCI